MPHRYLCLLELGCIALQPGQAQQLRESVAQARLQRRLEEAWESRLQLKVWLAVPRLVVSVRLEREARRADAILCTFGPSNHT